MTTSMNKPAAWTVLEQALSQKKPVQANYHAHQQVLCPHALGWKNGRAKVMSYQSGGTTSDGPLPVDPHDRWKCMFVEELEAPELIDDPWETADNHSVASSCLDQPPEIEVSY